MKALKIFRVNYDGRSERVVAARSRAEAARLMGTRDSHMREYGGRTWSKEQEEIAMREPGAVWEKEYRLGAEWRRVAGVLPNEKLTDRLGENL